MSQLCFLRRILILLESSYNSVNVKRLSLEHKCALMHALKSPLQPEASPQEILAMLWTGLIQTQALKACMQASNLLCCQPQHRKRFDTQTLHFDRFTFRNSFGRQDLPQHCHHLQVKFDATCNFCRLRCCCPDLRLARSDSLFMAHVKIIQQRYSRKRGQ